MAKRKVVSSLSGLVDSDGEDVVQEGAQTHLSNEPPAKKARGRPKAVNRKATVKTKDSKNMTAKSPGTGAPNDTIAVPKPKVPSKKQRGRGRSKTVTVQPKTGEQTSEGEGEERQGTSRETNKSPDTLESPGSITEPMNVTLGRKKTNGSRQIRTDDECEYSSASTRQPIFQDQSRLASKRSASERWTAGAREQDHKLENARSTPEVDETIISEEVVGVQPAPRSPLKLRANEQTSQRTWLDGNNKRALGTDNESSVSAPELRRKLGEMTKKYDNLEAKFRHLREVGVVEANANVAKLRRQCESTTNAAHELIASLKKELAAQAALAQQTRTLQGKLNERDREVAGLESKVKDVSSELSSAHIEIKALQTKLTAARNTSASAEGVSSKGPSSAVKNSGSNRTLLGGANATQVALVAQLKEDLYSDLTGLIIRDVKKKESGHLYDCIQTGINGTLHFKLAVSHAGDGKGANSYDNTEFRYIPLLEPNRDRDLVDLLPDYLSEEITFSRQNTWKFYTRVIDTLAKRVNRDP